MKVRLLYFARLREVFATGQETPDIPENVTTLADLLDWLRQRGGVWAEELAAGRAYRVAINQDLVERDALLHESDEVAIFPPVTGG
ncbi:MAG: molybdopterin converting factor subunit 1 [Pseudomonadota bacterium]|nr:molybdopterin converting factor subunit 1 [Pseudomonadota bacterium]